MITNVVGPVELETCPWRAFENRVVADVVAAWRWYDNGQVTVFLGNDPPAHIIAGLEVYQSALMSTRADRIDRELETSRKRGG